MNVLLHSSLYADPLLADNRNTMPRFGRNAIRCARSGWRPDSTSKPHSAATNSCHCNLPSNSLISKVPQRGSSEGHINRLKVIKRQMYGRAGFELLKARGAAMGALWLELKLHRKCGRTH